MTGENIGSVFLTLELDKSKYKKQINQVKNDGKNLQNTFTKLGKTMLAVFSVRAILQFSKASLTLASNLYEVQNVVDTTFGDGAEQIENFAKTATTQFGLSELASKKYTGSLGAMLKASGISSDSTLEMSKNLVALTGDMASFYNLDHNAAYEKIQSGLAGVVRPLRELGINMTVANLEAFALSQGINESYDKMSEANKVILRYNYLLSVTGDVQGDFSKTSDSMANQMRLTQLRVEELQASFGKTLVLLGQAVIPIVNGVINGFTGISDAIYTMVTGYQNLNPFIRAFIKGMLIGVSVIPTITALTWIWAKANVAFNITMGLLTKRVILFGGAVNLAFWQIALIAGAIAGLIYLINRWLGISEDGNKTIGNTGDVASNAANSIGNLTDSVEELEKATKFLTPLDEIMNLEEEGLGQSLIGEIDLGSLESAYETSEDLTELFTQTDLGSTFQRWWKAYEESKLYKWLANAGIWISNQWIKARIGIQNSFNNLWRWLKETKLYAWFANAARWFANAWERVKINLTPIWNQFKKTKLYSWLNKLIDFWNKLFGRSTGSGIGGGFSGSGAFSGGGGGGSVGGFASGGNPPINRPSVVGELGPEIFVPKTSGTIIPNNELGGLGGNIDYAKLATAIVQGIQTSGIGQQEPILKINGRELARATYKDFQNEGLRVGGVA